MNAIFWHAATIACRLVRRFHVVPPQTVEVADSFRDSDLIIDLGGGGEGVIGQLRGRQVVAVDLRKAELDETPAGPIKVVADARNLPFPDDSFEAATSFYFLLYVRNSERGAVLREAYRVLVPDGRLHVWDALVPPLGTSTARLFVVSVCAKLPGRTLRTMYGVPWHDRAMSAASITAEARAAGFQVASTTTSGQTFHLVLSKPG